MPSPSEDTRNMISDNECYSNASTKLPNQLVDTRGQEDKMWIETRVLGMSRVPKRG